MTKEEKEKLAIQAQLSFLVAYARAKYKDAIDSNDEHERGFVATQMEILQNLWKNYIRELYP